MPFTIMQRWEGLFGGQNGNGSPDAMPSRADGTDGNGLSGSSAISHRNPLRESSALDEGFNSSNPLPPGHHDSDVGVLWSALVANGSSSASMTSTVSGVGKSLVAKSDAIRRSGITVSKSTAGGYRNTRGNHRLGEIDTEWDRASASAAAGG